MMSPKLHSASTARVGLYQLWAYGPEESLEAFRADSGGGGYLKGAEEAGKDTMARTVAARFTPATLHRAKLSLSLATADLMNVSFAHIATFRWLPIGP